MKRLRQAVAARFHPNKQVRRIYRGGHLDVDSCKRSLEAISRQLSGVMSIAETIDKIIRTDRSIARIGDGEFEIIAGNSIPFQNRSLALQARLIEILSSRSESCLIGLQPYELVRPEKITRFADFSYADSCFAQISETIIRKTSPGYPFANALISRLPAFREVGLDRIRRLWHERDVVLVSGLGSAFQCDPRLFNNTRSTERVFGMSENAFSNYGELLGRCMRMDRDKLFLIALGPTATVLAFDLSVAGFQAIDVGHLSNCYHEYLDEAKLPERERKLRDGRAKRELHQ